MALLLGINMGFWDDVQKFLSGEKETQSRVVEGKVTQPTPQKPDYYERLKMAESSGDPMAKAPTSSALGHHQFTASTWSYLTKKYEKKYSLKDRTDPEKSLEIAKLYTEENRASLQKSLNDEPSDVDLYAAHFLGTAGAKKLLKASPNKLAKDVISKRQVANNKNIFFNKETGKPRTVLEVYQLLENKISPK